MEAAELVGIWWTTLRVPLAIVIAAVWFLLLRRRTVIHETETPLVDVKKIVVEPSSITPQAEIIAVTKRETSPTPITTKKEKKPPKKFTRSTSEQVIPAPINESTATTIPHPEIHIFYASQFKHTSNLAKHLLTLLSEHTHLHDISIIPNLDDYFLQHPDNAFYFLLLPSYANDSGPTQPLIEALEETLNDFRVDANPLRKLAGFAVFGTGDKEGWPLKQKFCYQATKVEKLMERLGARRTFAIGMGDAKGRSALTSQLDGWAKRVLKVLNTAPVNVTLEQKPTEVKEEEEDEYESEEEDTTETPLLDVEDMGPVAQRHKSSNQTTDFTPKPMVSQSSTTHQALTKQGYTIVGTHSGVKICRWTKSALRGRGSCYKFSFYGIKSHLCMETTPSLACANKCVFCWRHGTNPVGTTWRWQVDPPEKIYEGALAGHYQKINMLKGMMGVKPARYEEAKRVRHCALSLVGEPIFCMALQCCANLDPYINEFLGLLHKDHISSFLVTNAQHPSALRTLQKPTQLYVSIDASNKDSLKAIDRPLFKDFWERTLECLDILRERQAELRTVYRFTLVKGFNMDEIRGYGELVDRGRPWLIEIKGVTYCGKSDESSLTMGNVPFYEEVVEFAKGIVDELNRRRTELGDDLPEYQLAAEHAHSCCILIARTTLRRNNKWYTHIDYPRFFELLESGEPFSPADYTAETPEWAYFGEGGFNPEDVRVKRNKKADKEKEEIALMEVVEQINGRIGKVIEGEDVDVIVGEGCGD